MKGAGGGSRKANNRRAAAAPRERAEPREPVPAPANSLTYVYGIVQTTPRERTSLGVGVGEPPREVRVVRHGKVGALVSTVTREELSGQGVRSLRRDMKAHSAVLNRLCEQRTVLPVRFGFVVESDQAVVARLLEPQADRLAAYLKRLEGTVEITLKATYVEEAILREIAERHPQLTAGSGARAGYQGRIEVGRRIAAAIQACQEQDGQWLLDTLAPVVQEVRLGKVQSELMVLNASLLVAAAKLKSFDRVLEAIHKEVGARMTFDCVGPLPPYSFVDLRL